MSFKTKLQLPPKVVFFAKSTVAVGLILWLIQRKHLELKTLLVFFSPQPFLILLSITVINFLFLAKRWQILLRSQNLHCHFSEIIPLSLIGLFFNFTIPGGAGGDIVKSYYLAKNNPQNKIKAVVTIAMDRLLGLYFILLMALVVMTFSKVTTNNTALFGMLLSLCLFLLFYSLFFAFIFSKRLNSKKIVQKIIAYLPQKERVLKIYESFTAYSLNQTLFFQCAALSFAGQIFGILFFAYAGSLVDPVSLPLSLYFFVIPIAFLATAIPLTPAGLGVGQAAMLFIFSLVIQRESPIGPMAFTAWQIFQLLLALPGFYYYLTADNTFKRSKLEKPL